MSKRIGELLKGKKLVDEASIQSALRETKQGGKKLGQALVERGAVSAEDVIAAIAEQLGVKTLTLANYPINPDAAKLVPRKTCEEHLCVPLDFGPHNTLHVAMADPLNHALVQLLTFSTGKNIASFMAMEAEIMGAIGRIYDFGGSLDFSIDRNIASFTAMEAEIRHPIGRIYDFHMSLEELLANVEGAATVELEAPTVEREDDDRRSETVKQIVKTVLRHAVLKGASDIHMEPHRGFLRIRIRIDGQLQNLINVPKWLQAQVTGCTKIQASMDISEKRVPQDGKISARIAGRRVDFRVSTLPTPHGEKVVIRVMDKGRKRNRLDDTDLPALLLQHTKDLLRNEKGIILATGPTGSGKTTLLYAMLAELQRAGTNIVTVEDPIEYEFEGITQTQINEKAGLTFPNILRSILRQDPNVIMVGEIRDQATAEIAFRAAQTGHLVLSTLHTNGAAASVTRLADLGIEPYMISSTVLGIFAQRLVRRNCSECAAEDKASDGQHVEHFRRLLPRAKFLRGKGCKVCSNTGYRGRIGVYELLRFTPPVVDAVNAGAPEDQLIKVATANGMVTLSDECARLVGEGTTSISECAGIVNALMTTASATCAHTCPACNRDISPDFLTCPYCQYKLARICPKCSGPIKRDWRACPHCMTSLSAPQPAPKLAAQRASPASAADKPRVLIVNNEAPLRKAVTIILKQIGCEVVEAADGGDALDKAKMHRPDLVISDINMPAMDGYQLCKQVRKSRGDAFIPFIILTSHFNAEDKLRGFAHGIDDYITKPFDYRDMQARVKRLLARSMITSAA